MFQKINEQFIPEWNIFPNPASNFINIKNADSFQNIEISIYTLNGQLELQKLVNAGEKFIDITGLSNGVYLVRLKNKSQQFSQKLVIQR